MIERRFIPLPWDVRLSSTTSLRCGWPAASAPVVSGGSLEGRQPAKLPPAAGSRGGGGLSDRVIAPGVEGGAGILFVVRADLVQEDWRCIDATWMLRDGEMSLSPTIASVLSSRRSATMSNPVSTMGVESAAGAGAGVGAGRAGKSTDMLGLLVTPRPGVFRADAPPVASSARSSGRVLRIEAPW